MGVIPPPNYFYFNPKVIFWLRRGRELNSIVPWIEILYFYIKTNSAWKLSSSMPFHSSRQLCSIDYNFPFSASVFSISLTFNITRNFYIVKININIHIYNNNNWYKLSCFFNAIIKAMKSFFYLHLTCKVFYSIF